MDINEMMKYISYALMAIGVMAFFVSVITEVIKSWPGLGKLPTSAVAIVLSMALCPAAFLALMRWRRQTVEWHMMFACIMAAFIVALVAMTPLVTIQILGLWYQMKLRTAAPMPEAVLDDIIEYDLAEVL